jgi:hypothetical protein
MTRMQRGLGGLLAVVFSLGLAGPATAGEIYSNGTGGGPWSDPATWRGKAVPGPNDEPVIARGDVVAFDRNDDGVAFPEAGVAMIGGATAPMGQGLWAAQAALLAGTSGNVSCRQLAIDPKGVLTFKAGGGRQTLTVAGPIEVYGTITINARNQPDDLLELRLAGDTPEKRTLRLEKGGSLLMHGRGGLPGGRANVALTSLPLPALKPPLLDADVLGLVDATPSSSVDVQGSELVHVHVKGSSIDNTGTKVGERFNVADNHFLGLSRVMVASCDTPLIVNNKFDYPVPATLNASAIYAYASPLAEIRGNTIRGLYANGINGTAQPESAVIGNTIEKCATGLYWYGTDAMIKQLTVRGCENGVIITSMAGTLEDIDIEDCKTAFYHGGATAQVTNLRVSKIPKDGRAVYYSSGPLTLLNCNIRPEQIKVDQPATPPPQPPPFLVQSMEYLVVGVKGEAPAGAQVEVTTANPAAPLAPGATDLNIRNSPAPVRANGLTPLPKTLESLIVKAWLIDAAGKTVPAPEYTLKLLGPNPDRKVLKTLKVKPQDTWNRAKPNELSPTLEVSLP